MRFLVLGAGRQGSAAAFDLVRRDDVDQVMLADTTMGGLADFLGPWESGKLLPVDLDASDHDRVKAVMRGVDGVLCALPYYFNFPMARLAVSQGAHYCDLGGNTEIVEQQLMLDEEAREKGLSVIPDCGLAPGMVNILAQDGIQALDETDSVRIMVGGLPRDPEPPLNYQIVYSLEGVLDYYTTDALILSGGEERTVPALGGVETVEFPEPVGELEAFYTAGGISTMTRRYRGRVDTMEYKTLRYPGHAHIMKAIRDLGLLDLSPVRVDAMDVIPRDVFVAAVTPLLRKPDAPDLVAMRVEVSGRRDGEPRTVRYTLLDRFDDETGVTAMARCTGYSLAITALMQVHQEVKAAGATTPDHVIPAEGYISRLAERGVEIRREEA